MVPGEIMSIVAGIGCRPGCDAASVAAVVRRAADAAGVAVGTLAGPEFRAGEPGLRDAAAALGLALRFVGRAALAAEQPRCPTRSARAAAALGLDSVAEAAALAAAGPGGRLVLARIAGDGVTCALAETAA
jgi:cobalt-precorrin 5A hydrolase